MTSTDNDEHMSDGTDTAEAQEILSWRPGICARPLPSKGGPKFFGCTGASFELRKVDEQLNQYRNVLHSRKVRKASKLGKAEWVPQHGLAKVTKQGKFIQTMGHHTGDFFALYPEEALFLLDIGDIELTVNDVPLSLQEAFSVISCTKGCQFTLDDYTTYSYLVKRGFIVQRHGAVKKKVKSKRQRSVTEESGNPGVVKLPKLEDQTNIAQTPWDGVINGGSSASCREWYISERKQEAADARPISSNPVIEVAFPNMAQKLNNHLPAPCKDLLPAGIPSSSYFIEDIWFERIKKDQGKQHVRQYGPHSRKKLLGSDECKNWSEYRALRLKAQNAEDAELQKLHKRVGTWEVQPLVRPGTSSISNNLQRIKTLAQFSGCAEARLQSYAFNVQYNVYEAASAPFKKTNPGRANFAVVVTNTCTTPPTSLDILSLSKKSKGVPIRFAVVDDGQVSFYEFEMTNISII